VGIGEFHGEGFAPGEHRVGVVLCQAAARPDMNVDPVLLAFRKWASGDAAS
jgi:hypothetical protein